MVGEALVGTVAVGIPCGDWVISRMARSCVPLEDEARPLVRRRRCDCGPCGCDWAGVRGGGARLGVGAAPSEAGGASHGHRRRALVPG